MVQLVEIPGICRFLTANNMRFLCVNEDILKITNNWQLFELSHLTNKSEWKMRYKCIYYIIIIDWWQKVYKINTDSLKWLCCHNQMLYIRLMTCTQYKWDTKSKLFLDPPDPDRFVIVIMDSNPVTPGWQKRFVQFH